MQHLQHLPPVGLQGNHWRRVAWWLGGVSRGLHLVAWAGFLICAIIGVFLWPATLLLGAVGVVVLIVALVGGWLSAPRGTPERWWLAGAALAAILSPLALLVFVSSSSPLPVLWAAVWSPLALPVCLLSFCRRVMPPVEFGTLRDARLALVVAAIITLLPSVAVAIRQPMLALISLYLWIGAGSYLAVTVSACIRLSAHHVAARWRHELRFARAVDAEMPAAAHLPPPPDTPDT